MLRVVLAFVCLLVSVQGASTPRPLADISVPIAEGKKIRLSQYRGKVMVVALISTTCEHCITSMELLSKLQKEYGPRGFQAVGIAADDVAAKMIDIPRETSKFGFPLGYLDQTTTMQLFDFKARRSPLRPHVHVRG